MACVVTRRLPFGWRVRFISLTILPQAHSWSNKLRTELDEAVATEKARFERHAIVLGPDVDADHVIRDELRESLHVDGRVVRIAARPAVHIAVLLSDGGAILMQGEMDISRSTRSSVDITSGGQGVGAMCGCKEAV